MKLKFAFVLVFCSLLLINKLHSQTQTVFFDLSQADLDENDKLALDTVVRRYKPNCKILLKGFTDSTGTAEKNLELAKRRAQSVRDYLVTKKIPISVFTIESYGELAQKLSEDLGLSRRVEAYVTNTNSISEFYEKIKKEKDVHIINNQRDTVIVGKRGTLLYFPARCFKVKATNQPTDKAIVYLQEFYNVPDYISANLSTQTSDSLLETNGLVYVEAQTKDGKELKVSDTLGIGFPIKKDRKEIQLFGGEYGKNRKLNWKMIQQPKKVEQKDNLLDTLVFMADEMPEFKSDKFTTFEEFVQANVVFPKEALAKKINGTVYVRFIVNKVGDVVAIQVVRGVHPLLDAESIRVVKLSPKWKAGRSWGTETNVYLSVPVEFASKETPYAVDDNYVSPYAQPESFAVEIKSRFQTDFENCLKAKNVTASNFYFYRTKQLSWLGNALQMNNVTPKVTLKIDIKPNISLDVKVILGKTWTILNASKATDAYYFQNLPKDIDATVFVVKYENGAAYFATKRIKITDATLKDFEFKKVDINDIKQQIFNMLKRQ